MTRREVLDAELGFTTSRTPYARVTVTWSQGLTSGKVGDQALVTADGEMTGWIGGACSRDQVVRHCRKALSEGSPRLLCLGEAKLFALDAKGRIHEPITCASEGALELFIEPRLPAPQLVVIGDAPVARMLCRLGRTLGYDIVVAMLEDGEREEAHTLVRTVSPCALKTAGVDETSFVVVATMGQYDEDAVYAALKTKAPYVALVASPRRAGAVVAHLKDRDVCGGRLARLHAPAGLDLGAVPHEEISVAVLAEIVAARASGVGRPRVEADVEEAIDPICGMTVEVETARFVAEQDGQPVYFCCAGCRTRFLKQAAGS